MKKLVFAILLFCGSTVSAQQFVSVCGDKKQVSCGNVVYTIEKISEDERNATLQEAYRYMAINKLKAQICEVGTIEVFNIDNFGEYIPIEKWIATCGKKYGIPVWMFTSEANTFYRKYKKGKIH